MSNELKVVDTDALTTAERTEIDANIESLISAHKNNRQEINRLVFESVAAMTAGEDYERQLANKSGIRRFIGSITGSNKALQDKINSNRAAAQYASQQTLQRIAEQNLMSFDLITAVNNKLNASLVSVEGEINKIYAALLAFFKQSRSDVIHLENRVDRLERNVNLLNWQNSIEYQMFDGVEYSELSDVAKVVCLARDFFDITKGEWNTSDLLLMKAAMGEVGLPIKGKISYYSFIKELSQHQNLQRYLLNGQEAEGLMSQEYTPPISGLRKRALLTDGENYVVQATEAVLRQNGVMTPLERIVDSLLERYLRQESGVNVKAEIEYFDFIMELLYNLHEIEAEKASEKTTGSVIHVDEEIETAAPKPNDIALEPSESEYVPPVIISCAKGDIAQPVKGKVIPLSQVPDEVFANEILGKGVGIEPTEGVVISPFAGEIISVSGCKHAIMLARKGMEVLIHVGIGTASMGGNGFSLAIKEGDTVKKGQIIMTFNRAKIKDFGFLDTVVVLLTNADDISDVMCNISSDGVNDVTN